MTSKTTTISNMKQWDDPIHITNYYKTESCKKFATRVLCECYASCPFYHGKKERRRSFETYFYSSAACEFVKVGEEWKESTNCPLKDECPKCHTRMEQQFHPEVYKKMQCKDLQTSGACPRGAFCAFAHNDSEIQGKRNPEWNFDWAKILPAGVLPQYNTTKRGSGKKVVDNPTLNNTSNNLIVSKPINIIPPPPSPSPSAWSGDGSSTLRKLLSSCGGGSTTPSPSDNNNNNNNKTVDLIFESPKIPGRLPYTFAAILAGKGHNDDTTILIENNNNKNDDKPTTTKMNEAIIIAPPPSPSPESENNKAVKIPSESTTKDEEPVVQVLHHASTKHRASFADILSGARSRSEALPNRIGSLNSLIKKPSVEIKITASSPLASPLPSEGDANNNIDVFEDVMLESLHSRSPTTLSPSPSSDLCTREIFTDFGDGGCSDIIEITSLSLTQLRPPPGFSCESLLQLLPQQQKANTLEMERETKIVDDNVEDIRRRPPHRLTGLPTLEDITRLTPSPSDNDLSLCTSDLDIDGFSFSEMYKYNNNDNNTPSSSTASQVRPPPGFAYESSLLPQQQMATTKAPQTYSADLFDEDFDPWVPLEEYAIRYIIKDGDFSNIIQDVQREEELRNNNYTTGNSITQNIFLPQTNADGRNAGNNECGDCHGGQYHFDLWFPYYRYQKQ